MSLPPLVRRFGEPVPKNFNKEVELSEGLFELSPETLKEIERLTQVPFQLIPDPWIPRIPFLIK